MTPSGKAPRWQFGLRSLFGLTLIFAILFAVGRWAHLTAASSAILALILSVALLVGFALVAALADSLGDDADE